MLNMRNQQLDKIIITAMDRFVWFVLLVVISHLVTEFTRATGYTRVPRQDVVTVNDVIFNTTYKSTESSTVSWSGIWTLRAGKPTVLQRQQSIQQLRQYQS